MNQKNIKEIFDNNHNKIINSKPISDSLFAGKLGLAYYHAILFQHSTDIREQDISILLLEEVLNEFYDSKSSLIQASYTGGAAGLGYAICYLNRIFSLELDIENELSDLDEYIFNSAVDFVDNGNLDCLHGAGGMLFYFTERGNVKCINKLVHIILSKAIRTTKGIWFPNLSLGPSQEGIANLSISHGMAGLLIIILKSTKFLNHENINMFQKILRESIKFITSFYSSMDLENDKNSFYPPSVDTTNNHYSYNCRLAWCYGDLGIALLFYESGQFLKESRLIDIANEIGLQTLLRKSPKETGVSDPFYCHGTAGLSSFYYKLYRQSGNENYLDGMDYWMKETKEFFASGNPKLTKNPHEILDGLIGVNISILEFLNKETTKSFSQIFFL